MYSVQCILYTVHTYIFIFIIDEDVGGYVGKGSFDRPDGARESVGPATVCSTIRSGVRFSPTSHTVGAVLMWGVLPVHRTTLPVGSALGERRGEGWSVWTRDTPAAAFDP